MNKRFVQIERIVYDNTKLGFTRILNEVSDTVRKKGVSRKRKVRSEKFYMMMKAEKNMLNKLYMRSDQ